MTDIFSLAPEGQAWADDKTQDKIARPDDYEPTFLQGAGSAIFSGAAEGTIGLAQSAVGFSQRLISDPAFTADIAPTLNIFRAMFPEADESLNDTYQSMGKQLQDARSYVKPDAGSQGTAADVIHGLGQFIPAIGTTIFGGPVIGAATAFGSTYEQSYQDFKGKGVEESTARNLATQQSLFNAAGMALPAAVGTTLATRIASGVAINTGFGGLNRYSVGETLEEKGYTDMAKQYRVFDGQAMLVDAVLGGAFGGAHHFYARGRDNSSEPNTEPETQNPAAEAGNTEQSMSSVEPSSVPVEQPPTTRSDAETSAEYDSRLFELQDLASQLIPVGDRKSLISEIHSAQRALDNLEQLRQTLKGGKATTSSARRIRNRDIAALDAQIEPARASIEQQRQQLASHSRGGKYFEAKADLSRIEQGIIPESIRGLVRESEIKPSDIDAAHILNEGLHYDIESAPVLHGSNESINSHVSAMDEAYRQLSEGQPVNVTSQVRGLDGPIRPSDLGAAAEQRQAIQQVFDENGIRHEAVPETSPEIPTPRADSAFTATHDTSSQVSIDPDTGQAISSASYDLMAARDLATLNPEMTIAHPDTGQPTKLADILAHLDEQIKTAQKESKVYSVAAACFLRNS